MIDAGLADVHAPDAMVDRDLAESCRPFSGSASAAMTCSAMPS